MLSLLAAALLAQPSPYMVDSATLAFVQCDKYAGTAVQIAPGRYVTAAHVVTPAGCKIGGEPFIIESMDVKGDWAILKSKVALPFYAVWSCDRLVQGQPYFASGYAEGNPWPVTTRLIAEHYREDGETFLKGSIIAGMSGGSVVDNDGVLHGINDTRGDDGVPMGGIVELADTPLCKAHHA